MSNNANDFIGDLAIAEAVKDFNEASTRLSERMLSLTKVLVILTIIMLVEVGLQIYIMVK